MKAIGYIRVSTDKQVSEGVSLQNQIKRIEDYCHYKEFILTDILEDAGISGGTNSGRVGFQALLEAIESREVQVLVIYSLERLSRDMLTLLAFERLLNEYEIELHTIEGHLDCSTPDGFMNYAMRAFLGEMERRQIKYRTKSAMKYKKSQNNVVGAVPYGYSRNGDQLEENPDEQKVISLANRMYRKGNNLTQICGKLNRKGITTRNEKPFRVMQVRRLITGYENIYKKKSTRNGLVIKDFITKIA